MELVDRYVGAGRVRRRREASRKQAPKRVGARVRRARPRHLGSPQAGRDVLARGAQTDGALARAARCPAASRARRSARSTRDRARRARARAAPSCQPEPEAALVTGLQRRRRPGETTRARGHSRTRSTQRSEQRTRARTSRPRRRRSIRTRSEGSRASPATGGRAARTAAAGPAPARAAAARPTAPTGGGGCVSSGPSSAPSARRNERHRRLSSRWAAPQRLRVAEAVQLRVLGLA